MVSSESPCGKILKQAAPLRFFLTTNYVPNITNASLALRARPPPPPPFQWYSRFYLGRRTKDDARQVSRWYGVTGMKGRWKRSLMNKVLSKNARFDDKRVSPVIRQTLLHWAYEIDAADMERHAKGKL